jgi:hypothetical protein
MMKALIQTVSECASRVITFENLDNDSSPDVHEASPPGETTEVAPPPHPFMLG